MMSSKFLNILPLHGPHSVLIYFMLLYKLPYFIRFSVAPLPPRVWTLYMAAPKLR